MKRPLLTLLTASLLNTGLTSCNLITAPLRMLNRTVRSMGGLGGAARLAPLLLDADEKKNQPVRGLRRDLTPDTPPSQRLENDQQVAQR